MSTDSLPLLRPKPRRPFDLSDSSPPTPETRNGSFGNPEIALTIPNDGSVISDGSNAFNNPNYSRTRSILNLTSSTLMGIYSPTGYNGDRDEPATPWGTGAQTPRDRKMMDSSCNPAEIAQAARLNPRRSRASEQYNAQKDVVGEFLNLTLRTVSLFLLGMGYGLLVTHLHDDRQLAPIHVKGIIKPSYRWPYLVFWGVSGVALGSLLPWIDMMWEKTTDSSRKASITEAMKSVEEETIPSSSSLSADWNPVVRSIGAFVGIAFAIVSHSATVRLGASANRTQRKLPWASPLQVSLTLFLVNPVLWYLIDRSKPGFLLSATVGLLGTTTLLTLNPEMIPSPASASPSQTAFNGNATGIPSSQVLGGLVSKELVECGTWIISVLFCSCVCFGNIGRRLALRRGIGSK
jgi:hypothetical protein